MTKAQMRTFANEIYKNELIHQNPASTKEEKLHADERTIEITNKIMAMKHGIDIMMDIDEIVSKKLKNNKEII